MPAIGYPFIRADAEAGTEHSTKNDGIKCRLEAGLISVTSLLACLNLGSCQIATIHASWAVTWGVPA